MAYTNIPKPSAQTITNVAKPTFPGQIIIGLGYATGIIGPPTYSHTVVIPGNSTYTNLTKPTSSWTNINKPT